ncbi:MAG: hypothetical protein LCH54_11500 [Bacteroidetes bacterium]|nr:hypothetical protein [Bacteroidota bacterium]
MINRIGFLVLFFLFPLQILAQDVPDSVKTTSDPWFGSDKVKHFTLSYFLTVAGTVVIKKETQSSHPEIPAAAGVLLLGIGKEIRDGLTPGNHFCLKDLIWDVAGLTLAVGLLK